ncbi:MAG: TolC family protein [Candidatus Omnitrophica bacterium]|nr:TolC family protein [Candidatus Omnitrophota bacterium]
MFKYLKTFPIILAFLFISCRLGIAEETLSWQDCIKEAAKNHPDLIVAQEGIKESQASKAITTSTLFPQIDSSLSASTSKTTATSAVTGAKTSTTTDSYSYGVSGTQLIFDGFKTVNDVKSASENVKAAQQSYRFTSSEVRLNLRTAFINLLTAQELVHVAEEIVKIRRDDLELIALRYESGLENEGALLTAEADLKEANFELSEVKRDVEVAQRQLTKEMGREKFNPMSVKGEFAVKDAVKEKPDYDTIVKNNPSLLQAVAKKNAASFSIKSAYANFSPELSGNVGADKSSSTWPPRDKSWNAGLTVSMPIFEGGLRLAQVSQAKALYKQAEANERSAKDVAVYNLAQTWAQLQDTIEAVDVQYTSLNAAAKRSEIAEAQYSTGFISFDNWTIIEDNLVAAKKSYLNSQANMLFAEANWIQAKGETLEYE